MAIAGSLTYDTKIDREGFNKGLKEIENSTKNLGTKIKNIVTALGIDKIISTTMNTLKSSISSAMGRIDTMDQFTRVMTVMTGSSEKADEALESIKNTVTGTAYGLDVASKSTQKFVTSGMKIDKSTKQIQTWADAVAFYGDGTNATFEGVTDALSKMVAKGKVEMDQLNRLTDAGIPAVQIYADSVGKSVTEVQDDLSKGKISTEQFLDGLDNAFNNGTNKFASITGAAKEAGSSWTATFDNFKAAITRGMTKIIDAIDEGLKSVGLKTMREMIAQVGKQAEKVMNKIAPLIKNGIKKLKDVYDWIKRNKDIVKNLIIVIGSLTAGYIAYQKVLVAIKAIQTVKNIVSTASAFLSLIPSIRSAKDAMLLLNMAFSANPVGLVVAGLATLATAFTVTTFEITKQSRAYKEEGKELDNTIAKHKEFVEQQNETMNSTLSEMDNVKKLTDELKTLVDENGKVKKGYETRVDFILNELNGAFGTEYKRTGEVIDKYKELESQIDKMILKKKANAILENDEAKYNIAQDEKTKAYDEMIQKEKKLEEAKQKTIEATKKFAENEFNSSAGQRMVYASLKKEAENAQKVAQENYDKSKNLYHDYLNDIATYENDFAIVQSGNDEKIKEMITRRSYTYKQSSDDIGETINHNIQQVQYEVQQYKLAREEDLRNQDTMNAIKNQTQIEAGKQQILNLAEQLKQMTSTTEELTPQQKEAWKNMATGSYDIYSEIVSDMDKPLREKIQDMTGVIVVGTPEMQEKSKELGRKTVEEFDKSADAKQKGLNTITGYLQGLSDEEKREFLKQAGVENVDAVLQELDKGELSEKNGKNILQGLWKGLSDGQWKGKILGVASGLAQAVNKAFTGKDGWDEHSPSKKMKKFAENYIQPISDVMNNRKRQITDTAKKLANSVNDSFNLEKINNEIYSKMQKAVSLETASINTKASIKANNSMLNVLQATFNVDGSVNIDGQKAGRILTPYMTKTLRTGGAY